MTEDKVKQKAIDVFTNAIAENNYYIEMLMDALLAIDNEFEIEETKKKIAEHQENLNIFRAAKHYVSGGMKDSAVVVVDNKSLCDYIIIPKDVMPVEAQMEYQNKIENIIRCDYLKYGAINV